MAARLIIKSNSCLNRICPNQPSHDDITPTDAHNTYKVAVDFLVHDVNFTMAFNPSNAQHTAIKEAYLENTALDCRLIFEDSRIKGYGFKGTLSKFTPKLTQLRYKGTLVISGEIDHNVSPDAP